MSEKDIQRRLLSKFQNRKYNFLNTFYYENESDFLSVTISGQVYEYEIKVSVTDFKKDFKKMKHKLFTQIMKGQNNCVVKTGEREWLCHFLIRGGKTVNRNEDPGRSHIKYVVADNNTPSKFYFVVPDGLVKPEDCPDYAGLIYVSKLAVKEVKRAPQLHKNLFKSEMLFNKMYYSYRSLLYQNLYYNNKNEMPIEKPTELTEPIIEENNEW